MNEKEIGEIRRRVRRDRSNMTAIFGCYVNEKKEIISEFQRGTAIMPENEADKYFGFLRRTLSGTIGKNLIDITFQNAQVMGSPEHQLLMDLRKTALKDEEVRMTFYRKVIESVVLEGNYLILLGCDSYDVPFKSKDGDTQADASQEVYTYLLCAVCPVKQTKAALHYVPEEKCFHDGGITNVVSPPEIGFLFPAFDNRATNIYNALYYTHSTKNSQEGFVAAVFNTPIPKPAQEQKKSFEALLTDSLGEECSLDVVQAVHGEIREKLAAHKESKEPEQPEIYMEEIGAVLKHNGVPEEKISFFNQVCRREMGDSQVFNPGNLVEASRFEVKTPKVKITVDPEFACDIDTGTINGKKYILIPTEKGVSVNGIEIYIS